MAFSTGCRDKAKQSRPANTSMAQSWLWDFWDGCTALTERRSEMLPTTATLLP